MTAPTGCGFEWDPEPDETLKGVDSQCLFATESASGNVKPALTVAVPTFRRPALLIDTVRSVLAQTDLHDVELLVFDNDPESTVLETLLGALPALRDMAFRYYRNRRNAGMFGNWNACLASAQGKWVTILNDDDLLDPPFIATMREVTGADPTIDAVTCSYRFMDCRPSVSGLASRDAPVPWRERVRNVFRFGWRTQRRLRAWQMFFGNIAGNSLGLVVRRDVALAIGGFRSAEFPSADYYFLTRLARSYRFIQLRRALAVVRVAENESARPETLLGFLRCQSALQHRLLGHEVPAWWRFFQAPSMHLALSQLNGFWRASIPEIEASRATGQPVSGRGAWATKAARLLMGAI